MAKIYPVIMSGGSGTRMWPLSRKSHPKQYHSLVTEHSMFGETLRRVSGVGTIEVADPIVICAANHEKMIIDHAAEEGIDLLAVITEPMARNTAAVGAVAASFVRAIDPQGLILLLPADHHVQDIDAFWKAVSDGVPAAADGYLTTLGIQPTAPETGYGYIKTGRQIGDSVYEVDVFKEKPDALTAGEYLQDGSYFWNAGIFLFSADALDGEYRTHAEDIHAIASRALERAEIRGITHALCPDTFAECRSDSIDYAIMEKSEKSAIVAPVAVGWSDVGSWSSIVDLKKALGLEAALFNGDVLAIDTSDTLVHSTGPLVATLGVENLVIVATGDAVLVARADRSQDIKRIVEELKKSERTELL